MGSRGDNTETLQEHGRATAALCDPVPGLVVAFSEAPLSGDGLYPLQEGLELSVGRGPSCAVFLEDPGLSRLHAVLRRSGDGGATVADQGSRNGSCLDGRRLRNGEAALMTPGGLLRCGRSLLTCVPDLRPYQGWRTWGTLAPLVGGPAIKAVREEVRTFAAEGLEVLILGESGTGKELVARELHRLSGRSGPLVAANCAAIAAPLFEAELFGAARGAFTGAVRDRPGLMQAAGGGTLFLDEVSELPLPLQAKLLRAVEQREVRPLGQARAVRLDLRVVAATNRDLAAEVQQGRFRADLYHRLRGAEISLPPLGLRPLDIPLLAEHLMADRGPRPSVVAMERLMLHGWPGNVRELDRTLREARARAAAAGEERILVSHLRPELRQQAAGEDGRLQELRTALSASGGNVLQAASALGVSRAMVYKLLAEHGLRPDDFRLR